MNPAGLSHAPNPLSPNPLLVTDFGLLRSRSHCLHTRLPDGVIRVFSGVYSCPRGHCVLLRQAWSCLIVFSLPVTASRWSGLQHARLRHKWSNCRPWGISWPLWCSHIRRCVMRSGWPGPRRCLPYPLGVLGPVQFQHPLSGSTATLRLILANSVTFMIHGANGMLRTIATGNNGIIVVLFVLGKGRDA